MERGKPGVLRGRLCPVAYRTGRPRERIYLPDELPACTSGGGRDVARWSRPSALVQSRIGGDEPSPPCKNRGWRRDGQNYLPPLPLPDTDQPAVDAYRALGAMALLDIDFWKGESERRIEDHYANLLHHLQNHTAFIALDEVRRPIGYATWRKAEGDNTVILTRQAAPFGDHLLLQKALERHLGQNTDIQAQHPSSARQEQAAW